MAKRELSTSGYYHVVSRTAGQVALFEDDQDRRRYLHLLKDSCVGSGARVIAWVLMTNHVHLVLDFGETPGQISSFMRQVNHSYSRYFNAKTGRSGTLFQGEFWSRPIDRDAQLIATVHYVHMNPEAAGLAPMREYRWSSYREYAGTHWMVDTSVILGIFGSFEAFDSYTGSPSDVVMDKAEGPCGQHPQDADVLAYCMRLTGAVSSAELRTLPLTRRDSLIRMLSNDGVSGPKIARALGIGPTTVYRILHT